MTRLIFAIGILITILYISQPRLELDPPAVNASPTVKIEEPMKDPEPQPEPPKKLTGPDYYHEAIKEAKLHGSVSILFTCNNDLDVAKTYHSDRPHLHLVNLDECGPTFQDYWQDRLGLYGLKTFVVQLDPNQQVQGWFRISDTVSASTTYYGSDTQCLT